MIRMVQNIYSAEETDKMIVDLVQRMKKIDTRCANALELLNDKLVKVYNELFSMSSDNTNMIHLLIEQNKDK